MGKKALKLPSLFKTKEAPPSNNNNNKQNHHHHHHHPWAQFLPSCSHPPKTLSFRRAGSDDIFKTVNSVFFDPSPETNIESTPESWFTTSSESASFSTESEEYYCCHYDGESLEMLVRGVVRSERLFFEPGDTSSILEKAKANGFPFKESVVLAMESEDPYEDFKRSMEEMVESHGVKDWEGLEELLSWYLRVNGKNNHGFIIGAFVDLLISIAAANSTSNTTCSDSTTTTTTTTYYSAVSSVSSSSPLNLSEGQNEIIEIEEHDEDTVTS